MGNSISGLRTPWKAWGRTIQLSADGAPKHKTAGVTFDWDSVTAVAGAPIQYEDGVVVNVGEKALRYGSILRRNTDGRFVLAIDTDTLVVGETFAVNETVKESDQNSNHPPCIQGGTIFRDRLLVGGAGQPTLAAAIAAIPNFTYAYN